ncbi:hypothetical protein Rsub_11699 [Raphidocelis subcapitata]|uniref:Protein SirB1 N-terminal domain-containing protein n=1 Tax=Raphidocelis subcapitata TaxID=307507 RepID=A0A2V0PG25_9CHLO|nr:hypothetical protein Rsub_11699 [Raphidocelis subcapitata]|eukprot:GBF98489.1 hypothetical protein Rsub_11699 [Raphidocelis subcapitata]
MPAAGAGGAAAVARPLLRALRQQVARFEAEGLPLTGVVGAPGLHLLLDPAAALHAAFEGGGGDGGALSAGGGLDGAFSALRMLPRQLDALTGAEEETRRALRCWSELQADWRHRLHVGSGAAGGRPAAAAAATWAAAGIVDASEAAAWALHRLAHAHEVESMLLEDEAQERERQLEGDIASAREALDSMAAQVREEAGGGLFDSPAPGSSGQDVAPRQLEAVGKAMFGPPLKFKFEPFEWVYDGLSPALLPHVLDRRKGAPLALAMAAAGVARRLGVAAYPVCAHDAEVLGVQSGPAHMQGIPAEVAARQAGRVVAAPPSPNTWLVAVGGALITPASGGGAGTSSSSSSSSSSGGSDTSSSSSGGSGGSGGGGAFFFDVVPRGGALLSESEARARYPNLGGARAPVGAHVVGVWAELARMLVMAHQRRGESDLVAHWMYQALALDTRAPEWGHLLDG